MGGRGKSRGRRPIVDAAAKVAMLAALREGRRLDEVAASYGVTLQAFYSARRRDPLFAAAWRDAHALAAEAERGAAEDVDGEAQIVPNNRRVLQRRRIRHVRFDDRRKGVFLAHFARSCDLAAAAAAAGVCERTVFNHLRLDPAFAAAFRSALEEGYAWLEAEAVRQRLEAQERLRQAREEAENGGAPLAPDEEGAEFDRTMKLLARWDRKHGGLGAREVRHGRMRSMSFEDAIDLLDRRLRALGLRTGEPPPEEAG
ncbi:MAG TPA: hypothetical protein VK403_11425 [Allosphingosinicella sp.]|nr:hypothetical protein [Allosphingosinicella sp.]